jgi:hypothetical protein
MSPVSFPAPFRCYPSNVRVAGAAGFHSTSPHQSTYKTLGQRLALVVYEYIEDAKQAWIEWHQAGMVGHQQRTCMFVESDVGRVGPWHRIRGTARVRGWPRVTRFLCTVLLGISAHGSPNGLSVYRDPSHPDLFVASYGLATFRTEMP